MQYNTRVDALGDLGAGVAQGGDAWPDSLGSVDVRVQKARWDGDALRTAGPDVFRGV